jgi:hypothetical protein
MTGVSATIGAGMTGWVVGTAGFEFARVLGVSAATIRWRAEASWAVGETDAGTGETESGRSGTGVKLLAGWARFGLARTVGRGSAQPASSGVSRSTIEVPADIAGTDADAVPRGAGGGSEEAGREEAGREGVITGSAATPAAFAMAEGGTSIGTAVGVRASAV